MGFKGKSLGKPESMTPISSRPPDAIRPFLMGLVVTVVGLLGSAWLAQQQNEVAEQVEKGTISAGHEFLDRSLGEPP